MRTDLDHLNVFHSGHNVVMMRHHAASLAWNPLLRKHLLRFLQTEDQLQTAVMKHQDSI